VSAAERPEEADMQRKRPVRIENTNIERHSVLPSPKEIKGEYPLTEHATQVTMSARQQIQRVLDHKLQRHILVVGPCSVHDVDGARAYAERLIKLASAVSDYVMVVMRVYVEKPRTALGWKGLIYDPDLDGSCDIERGLRLARELMLDIVKMGLPVGTEVLDPVMPQYLSDLVSWAVIGARTSESQTHRQLASGLSMPTAFKNATDGNINVAVDAVRTARSTHSFLGVTGDGRSGFFRTTGNRYGHIVLRGGTAGPNYGSEHVAYARELMKKTGLTPNIMVDCSHGNSSRQPQEQERVMDDVLGQVTSGEESIVGSMLESNLQAGSQQVKTGGKAKPGVSVTDPCLGWSQTEELIHAVHARLAKGGKQ
jgi:3-deoxy-7-phosphoheptulonate synthase